MYRVRGLHKYLLDRLLLFRLPIFLRCGHNPPPFGLQVMLMNRCFRPIGYIGLMLLIEMIERKSISSVYLPSFILWPYFLYISCLICLGEYNVERPQVGHCISFLALAILDFARSLPPFSKISVIIILNVFPRTLAAPTNTSKSRVWE